MGVQCIQPLIVGSWLFSSLIISGINPFFLVFLCQFYLSVVGNTYIYILTATFDFIVLIWKIRKIKLHWEKGCIQCFFVYNFYLIFRIWGFRGRVYLHLCRYMLSLFQMWLVTGEVTLCWPIFQLIWKKFSNSI